jgi:predicted metal-dependent hydrolase
MTTMTATSVHALDTITVGDLRLTVAPPTGRTSIEITVDRDASLILKAPDTVSSDDAVRFIESKRTWIYRKLAEKDALVGPTIVKQFVDGEGFAYLGRSYRLRIVADGDDVRLDHGRFTLPAHLVNTGPEVMRRWYRRAGRQWLQHRLPPWAARMGFTDVDVTVSDLGYRWGSARPQNGYDRINIHWATLQLPPSLIDYVLVHELAHLTEPNHNPDYWNLVERAMPRYENQKTNLAAVGKGVWLGAVG